MIVVHLFILFSDNVNVYCVQARAADRANDAASSSTGTDKGRTKRSIELEVWKHLNVSVISLLFMEVYIILNFFKTLIFF